MPVISSVDKIAYDQCRKSIVYLLNVCLENANIFTPTEIALFEKLLVNNIFGPVYTIPMYDRNTHAEILKEFWKFIVKQFKRHALDKLPIKNSLDHLTPNLKYPFQTKETGAHKTIMYAYVRCCFVVLLHICTFTGKVPERPDDMKLILDWNMLCKRKANFNLAAFRDFVTYIRETHPNSLLKGWDSLSEIKSYVHVNNRSIYDDYPPTPTYLFEHDEKVALEAQIETYAAKIPSENERSCDSDIDDLFTHQKTALRYFSPLSSVERLVLNHPVGSGKTRTMVSMLDAFYDDPRTKIILCPSPLLLGNFEEGLKKYHSKYYQWFVANCTNETSFKECMQNEMRKIIHTRKYKRERTDHAQDLMLVADEDAKDKMPGGPLLLFTFEDFEMVLREFDMGPDCENIPSLGRLCLEWPHRTVDVNSAKNFQKSGNWGDIRWAVCNTLDRKSILSEKIMFIDEAHKLVQKPLTEENRRSADGVTYTIDNYDNIVNEICKATHSRILFATATIPPLMSSARTTFNNMLYANGNIKAVQAGVYCLPPREDIEQPAIWTSPFPPVDKIQDIDINGCSTPPHTALFFGTLDKWHVNYKALIEPELVLTGYANMFQRLVQDVQDDVGNGKTVLILANTGIAFLKAQFANAEISFISLNTRDSNNLPDLEEVTNYETNTENRKRLDKKMWVSSTPMVEITDFARLWHGQCGVTDLKRRIYVVLINTDYMTEGFDVLGINNVRSIVQFETDEARTQAFGRADRLCRRLRFCAPPQNRTPTRKSLLLGRFQYVI